MTKSLKLAVCCAALFSANVAMAGGYSEPEITAPVEVEAAAASTSAGDLLPLLLILLVGAAIASSDSSGDESDLPGA